MRSEKRKEFNKWLQEIESVQEEIMLLPLPPPPFPLLLGFRLSCSEDSSLPGRGSPLPPSEFGRHGVLDVQMAPPLSGRT